jgi:hypothetical protein
MQIPNQYSHLSLDAHGKKLSAHLEAKPDSLVVMRWIIAEI